MLKSVKISNIKLIEDVEISFNPGLNIISGETGAGKSIILNSLTIILGDQARMDLIRSGKDNARIQAVFDISHSPELKNYLENDLGINTVENLLIIDREIDKEKGSNAYINDRRVLVQTLKDIGQFLIDLHGQNQHQSLFNKNNHLLLLDKFAYLDEELKEYRKEFNRAIQLNKELKERIKKEEETEKFLQFNQYALIEIKKADLKPKEEEKLESELNRLIHAQEIQNSLEEAFNLLYKSEKSALSLLQRSETLLEKIKEKEIELKKILPFLHDTIINLEPVIDFLNTYKDQFEYSPKRIEEISKRLEMIRSLKKKYNKSINEIIQYGTDLEREIIEIENNKEETLKIEKEINKIREQLGILSLNISEKRRKTAVVLEKSIMKELKALGMKRAKFAVKFEYLEDQDGKFKLKNGTRVRISKNGIEKVEFLISTNLGEELKPLVKVASGGEISRIMLSIKTTLKKIDPILTLVFDEIDAGIGGETAFSVGKKLKEIGQEKQIICITHLAQIASMGDHQYKVDKIEDKKRTKTIIFPLNKDERIKEISRMLGGDTILEKTLEFAKHFLESNT